MAARASDVVVVGAGPTGLALALALHVRGVSVTVLDKQREGANTSRAAVVHARTLEVLERLGVTEKMCALGLKLDRFTARDRDEVLMTLRFDDLPTKYPFTLMISQAVTESVLLERLVALGGTVVRPRLVTGVVQDAAGVSVVLEDGTELEAEYVVGADGAHSVVRKSARIGFAGSAYEEAFSLADVRLTGGVSREEVTLYFSPAGLLVVAPLPGGLHRVVATVDESPEVPSIDLVQSLLDERGPEHERAVVSEIVWGSRFHVAHRLAETYRVGRVLLAGDAAHVHSPAGGQGMNTGIQDAVDLATALAAALSGAGEAALDRYVAHRRPVAEDVVALTDRLTRIATASPRLRPMRNVLLRGLGRVPPFRHALEWRLSELAYR